MADKQKHQTSLFLGIGIAVVFGFLPFVVKSMNPAVAWAGIAIGVLFILWGVWPLIAAWGWRSTIPLDEAARMAYEQLRGTIWTEAAERLNSEKTPEGVLTYMAQCLAGEVQLYGKYAPSTKLESLGEFDLNTGTIKDGGKLIELRDAKQTIIKDVCVKRADLRKTIKSMKAQAD